MDDADIRLSKTLSYFLRHSVGKGDKSITVDNEGFASVESLLSLPQLRRYTFSDVERVVKSNDKQRFALIRRPTIDSSVQAWFIRANQGHTFDVPDLALKEITLEDANDFDGEIVHASFLIHWPSIREVGLSRMSRGHVHFLPRLPNAGERRNMSGKLRNSDLFIFINLKMALNDGYKFYLSANNVVLCPGNDNGVIETKYFSRILSGSDDENMISLNF